MDADIETKRGVRSFQISEAHFIQRLHEFLEDSALSKDLDWHEPIFEDYKMAFEKIKSLIRAGTLDKAVPVLFAKAQVRFDSKRIAHALKKLAKSPSRLFVYGMWDDSEGLLGATPETLVTFFSGEVRSMALAGTQIKGTGECALLSDKKELHEHALTAQDIQNVLSDFGGVDCEGPHVLELPSLWHLKTEMRVKTSGKVDWVELIKKLHPTPALGVSPRNFNYQWMRELPEASLRKKFGAPFAVQFPNGDFISVVAIRNIQWNAQEIILGAGGGVVEESELQKEWLELQGKRNSVKSLMGL